jgi:uncharacterized short protein YbdD (DUF466 family)
MTRLSAAAERLLRWPRRTWQALRVLSGDAAYDRYLEHCREHHPDAQPLDRRAFYLREQERRYSEGPTSCC